MRCWADTRLSQSLSGVTLLSGCTSSGWAFPWSRLCRGSCGVPCASALSSFSQDKFSWLMALSPSTTDAKGDVACLEDMTLLRSDKNTNKRHAVKRSKCRYASIVNDTWIFPPWIFNERLADRLRWLRIRTKSNRGRYAKDKISTWLSSLTPPACQVCGGNSGP